jgi:hypothetical protein
MEGAPPGIPASSSKSGAVIQIRTFERADIEAVVALWEACNLVRP